MVYEMNTIGKSVFWPGVVRFSAGLKLGEEPEISIECAHLTGGIHVRLLCVKEKPFLELVYYVRGAGLAIAGNRRWGKVCAVETRFG